MLCETIGFADFFNETPFEYFYDRFKKLLHLHKLN